MSERERRTLLSMIIHDLWTVSFNDKYHDLTTTVTIVTELEKHGVILLIHLAAEQ